MAGSTPKAGRTTISAIARERRHTLNFLDEIRPFSPVFLDTEIDMTAVRQHRAAARERGDRYSLVSYVLYAAARTLAAHPAANAAVRGHWRPRVARHTTVNGKLTLDKTIGAERVVLATVLKNLQQASLDDIQQQIEPFRDGDPNVMPQFAAVRLLHKLPWPVGRLLFRRGVRPLRTRGQTLGTFAVTSLGHRPVDGFYSVGGTTITLGVGRVVDRAVVRDGVVGVAPVMRLSLTFDHRVIDGAEAADVLHDVKNAMEGFAAVQPVHEEEVATMTGTR